MTTHSKKIASVIIILFCLLAYSILYVLIITKLNFSIIRKVCLSAITVIVAVMIVNVSVERIREIKKGEEDDLSKY